jgi:hypothetical protein
MKGWVGPGNRSSRPGVWDDAQAVRINLQPQSVDLLIYAGDGVSLDLELDQPNGAPFDATGSAVAQIRPTRGGPVAAEFTVDLTNAATGHIGLSLTGDETAGLAAAGEPFNGAWDVQWTAPGNEPLTIAQGSVTCKPDVTRVGQ